MPGVNAATGRPGPAPRPPRDGDKMQARQRRAAPHLAAVERIREEGRAAARAALPIGSCPYEKASGGYRRAWRQGWSEFRGSTADASEAKP